MGTFSWNPSSTIFLVSVSVYLFEDYCAPKINYAYVRKRVQHAFVEKANEVADAIGVVQRLSRKVLHS